MRRESGAVLAGRRLEIRPCSVLFLYGLLADCGRVKVVNALPMVSKSFKALANIRGGDHCVAALEAAVFLKETH